MNIRFNLVYVTGTHNSVTYNLNRSRYFDEGRSRGVLSTKIKTVLQEIKR